VTERGTATRPRRAWGQRRATGAIAVLWLASAAQVAASSPPSPVRLAWDEGDVAGFSTVFPQEGSAPIGFIEYHQTRRGDLLECARVARFTDGSSDEDTARARVGTTLEAIGGRSIVRDVHGAMVVDLAIDVAGGSLRGSYEDGGRRHEVDERVELSPATYWGPLIFLVVKSFDANADGDRLLFRTVAPTPRPRVIDMVLVRTGTDHLAGARAGVQATRFELRPDVPWPIGTVVRWIVPDTVFFVVPGAPPALARFAGPRNYALEPIRIE
jgi:hypothetical protein